MLKIFKNKQKFQSVFLVKHESLISNSSSITLFINKSNCCFFASPQQTKRTYLRIKYTKEFHDKEDHEKFKKTNFYKNMFYTVKIIFIIIKLGLFCFVGIGPEISGGNSQIHCQHDDIENLTTYIFDNYTVYKKYVPSREQLYDFMHKFHYEQPPRVRGPRIQKASRFLAKGLIITYGYVHYWFFHDFIPFYEAHKDGIHTAFCRIYP